MSGMRTSGHLSGFLLENFLMWINHLWSVAAFFSEQKLVGEQLKNDQITSVEKRGVQMSQPGRVMWHIDPHLNWMSFRMNININSRYSSQKLNINSNKIWVTICFIGQECVYIQECWLKKKEMEDYVLPNCFHFIHSFIYECMYNMTSLYPALALINDSSACPDTRGCGKVSN